MDMKDEERKRDSFEHILTYTCATIDPQRRSETKRKIRAISSMINALKVMASDEGVQAAQAVQPPQVPLQPVYQYRAAKIQPLDMPRFNGDIARYKTFHINFDALIRCTGLPETLWGPYLYDHLDKKTQAYAGVSESWQGKYEELWEHLNSRFANRWTVAAETIKATIMAPLPEENDWEKMVEFIDDQLDRMKSLKALDLTNEQLATNVLLMKLPEDFSNAIRNGLRIARKNLGNEDFKFTPEEFRDVMNDTVMAWKTTQPHLVSSTVVLNATIPPRKNEQPSQQKQTGGSGRRPFRPFLKCQLCDSEDHRTVSCINYLGSAERRKQLVAMERCPDCTRAHDGNCQMPFKCRICLVGTHLDYLCPGPGTPNAQE